ncbi:xanthine dehydrogenase family Fe-S subunit [Saccharopolyspora dendranthemae]|uniref:Carbon-monoxide dehydrogenase small subunit n=1 Tax=Saccharopolyspora dendranthemae TaxID=1181886 RepID=A0A561V7Q5_9PSEU|nr:2Fe-2S iron-sulfur cluster-binding protein [Saccharopolyspora dendranthemae]TWG07647.1 carbon-monoxide dehydrogenase small subunit [Saccharopolyspora dendranthemae]
MTSTEEPVREGLRPVRAEAGETVEVRFTVNGTPAVLNVPARVTLADALRDHLGLTGTHVGCEHGVCGMCTVLVDGEAARACLLFACQLDGAEVVTVEGLGRPDDLHPLQESFGRNHALQCGFCTPGFLLSSYDLLSNKPEVTDEELPAELSGVICRCTGYRNILTAVSQTRAEHPEGIPGPGNCARRALVGRSGGQSATVVEERAEPSGEPDRNVEIVLPEGDPTIAVQVDTALDVPFDEVWRVLDDVHVLARCLPGAELTEELGEQLYAGRARIAVGPIKLSFHGIARVLEQDRETGTIRVLAQGQDTGGAQTQADITLRAHATAAGTELRADAAVYLTGRIAQFGRALAGDISRRMFEQFADSVHQAATTGEAPQQSHAAPSAFRMMFGTLLDRIKRIGRSRGGK